MAVKSLLAIRYLRIGSSWEVRHLLSRLQNRSIVNNRCIKRRTECLHGRRRPKYEVVFLLLVVPRVGFVQCVDPIHTGFFMTTASQYKGYLVDQ